MQINAWLVKVTITCSFNEDNTLDSLLDTWSALTMITRNLQLFFGQCSIDKEFSIKGVFFHCFVPSGV